MSPPLPQKPQYDLQKWFDPNDSSNSICDSPYGDK